VPNRTYNMLMQQPITTVWCSNYFKNRQMFVNHLTCIISRSPAFSLKQ